MVSAQVVKADVGKNGNGASKWGTWLVKNLPTFSRKFPGLVGRKSYDGLMCQKISAMLERDKNELFEYFRKYPNDIVYLGKMIVDPTSAHGDNAAEFIFFFSKMLDILPIASMLHANWSSIPLSRRIRVMPALVSTLNSRQANELKGVFPGIEDKINVYASSPLKI